MNKNIKTFDDLKAIAEKLDWTVERDIFGPVPGTISVDFLKYTPAGEDFSFDVTANTEDELKALESICEQVSAYSADFDRDEHVAEFVCANRQSGLAGVPSISELVDDAKAIEEMLRDLAEALVYGELTPPSSVTAGDSTKKVYSVVVSMTGVLYVEAEYEGEAMYIADHVTTDKVNWSDIFTTDSAEEIPRETIEDQKVIKEPMF